MPEKISLIHLFDVRLTAATQKDGRLNLLTFSPKALIYASIIYNKAVTREPTNGFQISNASDCQSCDSRMTAVYWKVNLFSLLPMTKLTLILTLNDLYAAAGTDPHNALIN